MSLNENNPTSRFAVECLEKFSMPYSGDGSEIVNALRREDHLFFLDSSRVDPVHGRYSLIGFDPFYVFSGKGRDLLEKLRAEYLKYAGCVKSFSDLPFVPGVVGYLAYDYGLTQEKIKLCSKPAEDMPDAVFGFYDSLIVIDRVAGMLHIVTTGLPETTKQSARRRSSERLAFFQQRTTEAIRNAATLPRFGHGAHASPASSASFASSVNFASLDHLTLTQNLSRDAYIHAVRKILAYIAAGDVYQVNFSQRFEGRIHAQEKCGWDIYQALREISPTNFSAYFKSQNFELISGSPERFLSVKGGVVQSRPMKGTRPRGRDVHEDRLLRREITDSVKDKAELLMITDLMRNDLGKVCRTGSVSVRSMRDIEEYSTVFQATSTVEGMLHPKKDCFDLIQACFPGGSITGCPKIRAMEIIEEMEPTRRGIYTGCMGYIDFSGQMDLNIMIRTLLLRQDKFYFQTGGGIVADSDPDNEYQETLVKAQAIRAALERVYGR